MSNGQITAAREASKIARAGSAAVRQRFIARESADAPPPPLATMLRGGGGRGGAIRLKLYLSMLWMTRNDDAPVFGFPAQDWASLIGLDASQSAGARRINDALRWLEKEQFVQVERRRGASPQVRLLDDAGSGRAYRAPGPILGDSRRKAKLSPGQLKELYYVQLPASYWTQGWIGELSGAASAMYLALLHQQMQGRNPPGTPVWIAPSVGRDLYDLSDDTRSKGLAELQRNGLVSLERQSMRQGPFSAHPRLRNAYVLHAMREAPGEERVIEGSLDALQRPRERDAGREVARVRDVSPLLEAMVSEEQSSATALEAGRRP